MPAKKKQQQKPAEQQQQRPSESQPAKRQSATPASSPAPSDTVKHEAPKYAPPQPSIFAEYLWFPFYDSFVKLYPRCFSPNGITLFGIFATLLASLMLLAGMPVRPPMEGIVVGSSEMTFDDWNDTMAYLSSQSIHPAVTKDKLNVSDVKSFSVGAAERVLGYRRVWSAEVSKPANIHGKPINVVPDAVALAAAEGLRIVQEGPRAPSWIVADPNLTKIWDFQRPKLLHETLQCPLVRFEVAFSIMWKSTFKFYFAIQDKLVGYRATNYYRSRYVEAIEVPLQDYYYQAKDLVGHVYVEKILPVLASVLPAETLASPGRMMLIIAGLLNLVYCVADNTDGRHARRTKKSSFVGEYLDHGLDCVTSLLTTYLLGSAFGIEGAQAAVALFVVAVVTVMSHIVNQEKGFMIWGNRLFTVDEAMLAFGFGMIAVGICPGWVPALVPVDVLKSTFDIPTAYIPTTLAYVRVGELLWFGFLLSQISVALTLLGVDPTVFFRPSSATLVLNVAVMTYLTNTIPKATLLQNESFKKIIYGADVAYPTNAAAYVVASRSLEKLPVSIVEFLQSIDASMSFLFSYEALWVMLAACTCSLVIHAPIFAKCCKISRGTSNTSYLIALPMSIYTFFFVSAGLGSLIAVIAHIMQVRVNVKKLNARGKALAKQAAQKPQC